MTTPESEFNETIRESRYNTILRILGAIVISLSVTIAISLLVAVPNHITPQQALMGEAAEQHLSRFAQVLLARGIIQPINIFLFVLGASLLVIRRWSLKREEATIKESFFEGIPRDEHDDFVITDDNAVQILNNTQQSERKYHGSPPILIRRLQVGSRQLRQTKDVKQVQSVMQALSDIDHEKSESSYGGIRYLVWLIPTLGFLGTVIGIGQAITGFAGVIGGISGSSGQSLAEQIKPLLGGISHDLGIAFDTTLLALLLSAILVALMAIVQGREESLLSDLDEFCLRHFVSRISMPDWLAQSFELVIQQVGMGIMATLMPKIEEIKSEVIEIGRGVREVPQQDEVKTLVENLKNRIVESLDPLRDHYGAVAQAIRDQTQVRQSETNEIRQALTSVQGSIIELNKALKAIQQIQDLAMVAEMLNKLQTILEDQKQWLAESLEKTQDQGLIIVLGELRDTINDLREKGVKARIDVQAV